MNKPISMIREEFKQNIAELINASGLPIFVIEPIIADLHREITIIAQRQYEADKAQYEESLEKDKKKDNPQEKSE